MFRRELDYIFDPMSVTAPPLFQRMHVEIGKYVKYISQQCLLEKYAPSYQIIIVLGTGRDGKSHSMTVCDTTSSLRRILRGKYTHSKEKKTATTLTRESQQ